MNKFNFKTISMFAALAVTGALVIASSIDKTQAAEEITEGQKAEIKKMIEDYLMENPQVIMKSVEEYQKLQEKGMEAAASAKVVEHQDFLVSKDAPSAGNPDGDVTVVEFFDYNCGYCKRALSDIQELIGQDPGVRFVFHELPVLGPSSALAAQWALAAHKQGKYFEYHAALMTHNGNKDEAELTGIGTQLGLDTEKLKQDANSPEIQAMLQKGIEVSRDLGIQGTPGFVIGDRIVRGYIGPEGLKGAIAEEREKAQ
ncbi:MAG TPA: thioredoxin [Rhodospirillaceae bacterium]|nr:thioredoxin [Rhodospirillaceae bacterium]